MTEYDTTSETRTLVTDNIAFVTYAFQRQI